MKWTDDVNSPTGEKLVSDKKAKVIGSKFNLKKLKRESKALYKAADALTIRHNFNLDPSTEIFKRVRQGFANDIQHLIDQHLITLTVS